MRQRQYIIIRLRKEVVFVLCRNLVVRRPKFWITVFVASLGYRKPLTSVEELFIGFEPLNPINSSLPYTN
jgi:hypothetical protein